MLMKLKQRDVYVLNIYTLFQSSSNVWKSRKIFWQQVKMTYLHSKGPPKNHIIYWEKEDDKEI